MQLEKLCFRAGPTKASEPLDLLPGKATVFIGPNNGGKSAALRELFNFLHGQNIQGGRIFRNLALSHLSDEEIGAKFDFLMDKSTLNGDNVQIGTPTGGTGGIQISSFMQILKNSRSEFNAYTFSTFHRHFILNLDGQSRLGLVGRVGSQSLRERPNTTMARIFRDDTLRREISQLVYNAFGRYLLIDPTAMANLSYAFGDKLPPLDVERSFGVDAIEFFGQCESMDDASDGTKAFVGILTEIMAGWHDILLIDEPEAFLHPALAYMLGREITRHVADRKQLFVATHSPHFLSGCLSIGTEADIVRLSYRAKSATARIISKEVLRPMMQDPLLKSIGVLEALFYEAAVVTESDGDRAFYQEINSRLEIYGGQGIRHADFLNAHGKPEVVKIARMLRNIGIPAAMILDLDWIKEDGQVAARYFAAAGVPEGLREGLLATRRNVRKSLEAKDPDYKKKGGIRMLSGAEFATAEKFFAEMRGYGLFTVVNGELEHWLPQLCVAVNKSQWLSAMFQRLGSDPSSHEYVKPEQGDVWDFLRGIKVWTLNPDREGMDFFPD